MSERTIAPGLLLAMPQLLDPNFERSVILMIEHSPKGSWGLVMNRPSKVAVSEILASLQIQWGGDPEAVVWSGGPVQPNTGWLVHSTIAGLHDGETLAISPGVSLSISPGRLRVLAEEPPRQVRFLMGYAGWGAGQLEEELASGAWVNALATPELVLETPADQMWERALRSIGIDPVTLVPGRGIH